MINATPRLKGWQVLLSALFLGPFFLALYYRETRDAYPAARYFSWLTLIVMALCAYLMFTFTFSPFLIRIVYGLLFLSIFGLVFFYCWGLDAKAKTLAPRPKGELSFSRACAWTVAMGLLFLGLNNIIQAVYFWLLGQHVSVFFSPHANIFKLWLLVGLIYGFLYGVRRQNDYFNRSPAGVAQSLLMVFIFISLHSGIILALAIYPLQRLAPISYYPQSAELLFFILLFTAICLSSTHLIGTASRHGVLKAGIIQIIGIPLIALHVIVVSTYAVTINLTVASILEDRQQLPAAMALYEKAIPYVRHDSLLASLHHRQGTLHVLNQDYPSAVTSFKKVLTDYSEDYDVFNKARRYMDAFEKKDSRKELGRKILVVKHRTFEQAASCFPNSLSVILNFYEKRPINTRALSYAIKEGFSSGTFIWKAESFLDKNGYDLLTAFWQNKETLVALIEAGYPILAYFPGHVITLYGYDDRMDMFFTYDTAKSNRWNDAPFWNFQQDWMKGSFLISVVIPKGEKNEFFVRFPQFDRYRHAYQLWQKAHISDYYESNGNYWKDYNRYDLSKSFGIDRFKMNESYFSYDDFFPFPWDAEDWESNILPVLSQSWALDWTITEKYILYLLYSGQPEHALRTINRYQAHLATESSYRQFGGLLELKLAAQIDMGDQKGMISESDKLIGISDNYASESYWGHYFKARHMMTEGDLQGAADLLLSALNELRLGTDPPARSFRTIVDALDEIQGLDPTLIEPDKMSLIHVARIDLTADR